MTTRLGATFACRDGFDASFRLAADDAEIVGDEVYHRLTTDSVLGDSEDAVQWGIDVRRRCGAKMGDAEIAALGPELGAMLQGSDLIEHADVEVKRASPQGQTVDLLIAVNVTPLGDTGPLTFVFRLTGTTFSQVGGAEE